MRILFGENSFETLQRARLLMVAVAGIAGALANGFMGVFVLSAIVSAIATIWFCHKPKRPRRSMGYLARSRGAFRSSEFACPDNLRLLLPSEDVLSRCQRHLDSYPYAVLYPTEAKIELYYLAPEYRAGRAPRLICTLEVPPENRHFIAHIVNTPPFSVGFFRVVMPQSAADALGGDLEERYRLNHKRLGRRAANVEYCKQCVSSFLVLLGQRLMFLK